MRRHAVPLICVLAVAVALENAWYFGLFESEGVVDLQEFAEELDPVLDSSKRREERRSLPPMEYDEMRAYVASLGEPKVRRNPFRFFAPSSAAPTSALAVGWKTLDAVLFGEGRRVAWVGDRILRPGDAVGTLRVADITRDSIRLQAEDAEVVVHVGEKMPGTTVAEGREAEVANAEAPAPGDTARGDAADALATADGSEGGSP